MAELSLADSISTSTCYDKRWATNNILRTYQLEYDDGTLEERIDYADWRLSSMLKRITRFRSIKYNGATKFTTLMNNEYGTTTIYRLVLMFNGFMHPYEIEDGATIKLPYSADLEELINNLSINKNKDAGRFAII